MGQYRALVIGCDGVDHADNRMPCCADDAHQFAATLVDSFGFDHANIRLLTNRSATRRDVIAGLHWLLCDVGPDDRCVFYFSGLGHRVPAEGILREVLTLYDGSFFYDNELAFPAESLPPHVLTVVLDTCFDGGFERRFGNPEEAAVKAWRPIYSNEQVRAYRDRFASIDSFKAFGAEAVGCTAGEAMELALGRSTFPDKPISTLNGAVVTACRCDGVAYGASRKTLGLSVFTFALCGAFRNLTGDFCTDEVLDACAKIMDALNVSQLPQHLFPAVWGPAREFSFIRQVETDGLVDDALRSSGFSDVAVSSSLRWFDRYGGRALETDAGIPRQSESSITVRSTPYLLQKFGLKDVFPSGRG